MGIHVRWSRRRWSLLRRSCLPALAVVVAVLVLAGPAVAGPKVGSKVPRTADWTFAVYVDADNNLESSWDGESLPALLRVPRAPGVNVVAVVDRLSTDGVQLVRFDGGAMRVVATYPEKNMGDGATFAWFIAEVAKRFPARNLAVTAWDHGYGWRYFCTDDTSGGDRITLDEMRAALNAAPVPVDVLAFDCCNMADVAVAYEAALTDRVTYMVASEESVPLEGFAYDLMLAPLATDPSRTPEQLATDMVHGWGAYWDPVSWANDVCLSAVDVRAVGASRAALQTWVAALAAGMAVHDKDYQNALTRTWKAWASRQYDLVGLCRALASGRAGDDAAIRASSEAVAAQIEAAVVANHTAAGSAPATGLTVWWGDKSGWQYFEAAFGSQVAFAQPPPVGVGWYDLLQQYHLK